MATTSVSEAKAAIPNIREPREPEVKIIEIRPEEIKRVLISGIDVVDDSTRVLLDTVRTWTDSEGFKLEVVDGYRRLVTTLTPLEALILAEALLDYAFSKAINVALDAQERLEEYEDLLAKKLSELERPKEVFTPREVEAEINELKRLYKVILDYEEVIRAIDEISYFEMNKNFTIVYQVLRKHCR